jgi:hypothetical protein
MESGVAYYIRVAAETKFGVGPFSEVQRVATVGVPDQPKRPKITKVLGLIQPLLQE